jgi:hypothetical protein
MKSVIKKQVTKKNEKTQKATAQCCAKTSKNVPGCHD